MKKNKMTSCCVLVFLTALICLQPCAGVEKLKFHNAISSALSTSHNVNWKGESGEEVCEYIRFLVSSQINVLQESGKADLKITKKFNTAVIPAGITYDFKKQNISLQELIAKFLDSNKLIAIFSPEGLFILPEKITLNTNDFLVRNTNIYIWKEDKEAKKRGVSNCLE